MSSILPARLCITTEVLHFPGRHTLPLCLGPVSPQLLLICTLIIIIFSTWNNFQHFFVNMQMLRKSNWGIIVSVWEAREYVQPTSTTIHSYQLEVAGATDEECVTWQPRTFLRNRFQVWPRFPQTCLLFLYFLFMTTLSLAIYSYQKVGVCLLISYMSFFFFFKSVSLEDTKNRLKWKTVIRCGNPWKREKP